MARSKKDMLNEMEEMAAGLSVELHHFEKSSKNININYGRCINLKADFIREGYNWIMKINDGIGLKLVKIRGLCTPEQWRNYKMFGECTEQCREVLILREAQDILYKEIRSQQRPKFFKKTIREQKIKAIERKKKND